MRLRTVPITIAAPAVIAVAATGAFAVAAIPSSDGTIHGCYSSKGTLRVIDEDARCKSGERAISWNEKGAKGDQGATGPKGDTGLAGSNGQNGVDGPQGVAGLTGQQGLTGPKGDPGEVGPQGTQEVPVQLPVVLRALQRRSAERRDLLAQVAPLPARLRLPASLEHSHHAGLGRAAEGDRPQQQAQRADQHERATAEVCAQQLLPVPDRRLLGRGLERAAEGDQGSSDDELRGRKLVGGDWSVG